MAELSAANKFWSSGLNHSHSSRTRNRPRKGQNSKKLTTGYLLISTLVVNRQSLKVTGVQKAENHKITPENERKLRKCATLAVADDVQADYCYSIQVSAISL